MKHSPPSKRRDTSALLLAEESVQLLERSGLSVLSLYVIGTLPFLLGMTAYIGTMAHSGDAHEYLGTGALGLALLFLWMKALQARFAHHLQATLRDETLATWTLHGWLGTLCRQGMIHASAVVVYPIATIMILPIGFVAAFYQNTSVLDAHHTQSTPELIKAAFVQARRWPKQNHFLLWLCSPLLVCLGTGIALGTLPLLDSMEDDFLVTMGYTYAILLLILAIPFSPFAVVIFVNAGSAIFLVIELFHIITGADTLYARNPGVLLQNDLFIAIVCSITYLILDPVLKAVYTIRCYEGTSMKTGDDLRVILRRIPAVAACVAILFTAVIALPTAAEPTAETPQANAFNQAIDNELTERRYTWRMPRTPQPVVELPWLLQLILDFGESVRDWLKDAITYVVDTVEAIWDWFFGDSDQDPTRSASAPPTFDKEIRFIIGVLAALLVGVTGYLIWDMIKARRPRALVPESPMAQDAPDLQDEATTAADRPEDEWSQLAQELAAKGDFRLASRALFFSILAALAQREIIRIARFKSNMDYDHELMRRAASMGEVPQLFSKSALLYESVWYGEHEATAETLTSMLAYQEAVRNEA